MLKKTRFFNTLIVVLLLCSCRTTEYVEHEVVKHDSIYITAVSVDTLIQRDSVHTVERGDTVQQTVYKYIYKVRERIDTAYIERTDTVILVKTETTVVKKKDLNACFWTFVFGFTLPIIAFAVRRFHKR